MSMNEISITRAEMVPATSVRRVSATVPQTIALRVAGLPSVRPSGSAGQGSRTSNGISECLANTGKSQRRRHTWVRAGSGDIRRGSSVSRRRQVVLREYYGQLRNADAGRERGVRTMVERNLIPRQREHAPQFGATRQSSSARQTPWAIQSARSIGNQFFGQLPPRPYLCSPFRR